MCGRRRRRGHSDHVLHDESCAGKHGAEGLDDLALGHLVDLPKHPDRLDQDHMGDEHVLATPLRGGHDHSRTAHLIGAAVRRVHEEANEHVRVERDHRPVAPSPIARSMSASVTSRASDRSIPAREEADLRPPASPTTRGPRTRSSTSSPGCRPSCARTSSGRWTSPEAVKTARTMHGVWPPSGGSARRSPPERPSPAPPSSYVDSDPPRPSRHGADGLQVDELVRTHFNPHLRPRSEAESSNCFQYTPPS